MSTTITSARTVALEQIHTPENVRVLDEAHVKALAGSIELQGVLVPLVVRERDDGFELVAGFHRMAAATSLGLAEVPVVVREADTEDADRAVENIARKQLNPYGFLVCAEEAPKPPQEIPHNAFNHGERGRSPMGMGSRRWLRASLWAVVVLCVGHGVGHDAISESGRGEHRARRPRRCMDDVRVTLRVRRRGGEPQIFARWRRDGVQAEPPIGPGWLVPAGDAEAKPRGKAIGNWVDRRGRPPRGLLTVDAAWRAVPEAMAAFERKLARRAATEAREAAGGMSLGVGIERWLAARKVDDPDGRWEAWKHSHAKNMTNYARRAARELGPDRSVDSFGTEELRRWVVDNLKPMRNGRVLDGPPSRKLRATYAQVLTGFFSYAMSQGWIDEDPTTGLPAYRVRKKRAGDVLRREEYLTPDELERALTELRAGTAAPPSGRPRSEDEREQDAAMIMLMAMVGLRPGEAIALTWEYVDFEARVVRIVDSRTMGETGVPKSGSGRAVPMSTRVATALQQLRRRAVLTAPSDLVFIGRDGAHVDLNTLGDRFDTAQSRACIEPLRELRQMRNTFGTVCAANGVPLRTIQEWMGHASITTTEIYASFMPRDKDAALIEAACS